MADRYGADILASNPHNTGKVRSVEMPAEAGMVVEDPQSGYVGAVVRIEGGRVELRTGTAEPGSSRWGRASGSTESR